MVPHCSGWQMLVVVGASKFNTVTVTGTTIPIIWAFSCSIVAVTADIRATPRPARDENPYPWDGEKGVARGGGGGPQRRGGAEVFIRSPRPHPHPSSTTPPSPCRSMPQNTPRIITSPSLTPPHSQTPGLLARRGSGSPMGYRASSLSAPGCPSASALSASPHSTAPRPSTPPSRRYRCCRREKRKKNEWEWEKPTGTEGGVRRG